MKVSLDARTWGILNMAAFWVMELIRTQTQTILCPQEAKQNKIMMQ